MDHLDIIIAAIIVLAAIVICILCPAAVIAIIGVIVCAMSAVMGIADMVCMATHGGKDIATVLAENGHGTLAKIWSGVSLGLDIASIILPVGAGIKTAMTVGGKTFAQASKSMLKETWKSIKGIPKNIKQSFVGFKNACKTNGFLRTVGSSTWKGFKSITGIDDIQNLKNIGKIKNNSLLRESADWIIDEDNMKLIPKSDKAKDAMTTAGGKLGASIDSIPLKKNQGYIDVDWEQISVKTLGSEEGFSMRNLGLGNTKDSFDNQLSRYLSSDNLKTSSQIERQFGTDLRSEIYGKSSSRANSALSKIQSNSVKQYQSLGFTFHENYNMLTEHIVPTELHDLIKHTGGVSHLKSEIKKIKYIDKVLIRGIGIGTTNLVSDATQ